jgi:hypothetical protein
MQASGHAAARIQQQSDQQQQQPCGGAGDSGVLLHDAPLPPALLHALQQAFHSSSSDFWSCHRYGDDDTPFFSYVVDLQAAAAAGPSNALEAAALLLQQQLKQLAHSHTQADNQHSASASPAAAAAAAAATHVEWWAHTRPAWAPHQLHFDAAEGAFRRGLAAFRLAHPAAGSVLYLTGAGGPTLVLDQTTAGAVTGDQQQQQQQQGLVQQGSLEAAVPAAASTLAAAAAATAAAGECHAAPAAKRARHLEQSAANAGAAKEKQHEHHTYKHHHDYHHHHKHHHVNHAEQQQQQQQQQQQRPPLASRAWLVAPAAGRFAVWPGGLLHGVLPGAEMPLGEEEDGSAGEDGASAKGGAGGTAGCSHQQQQQQQQQPGTSLQGGASEGGGDRSMPAAAGEGAAPAAARTTLILAWWSCDPRSLTTQQQQQQQQQQELDESADLAPAAPTAVLKRGDSTPAGSSHSLGPCMVMPSLDRSVAPVWLQALANVPAADLAAGSANGSRLAGWRVLPGCCPAWEQVQPQQVEAEAAAAASAEAAAGDTKQQTAAAVGRWSLPAELLRHPFLCRAVLPCLRFFLRGSREIRAAYIPELEAWQQPAAAAAGVGTASEAQVAEQPAPAE